MMIVLALLGVLFEMIASLPDMIGSLPDLFASIVGRAAFELVVLGCGLVLGLLAKRALRKPKVPTYMLRNEAHPDR